MRGGRGVGVVPRGTMPGAARMLLRRCSTTTAALRRDGGLLDALRSELRHELSSAHTPNSAQLQKGSKVGSFTVDWDDAKTQDLVLRRRFASGEELVVSALLGPLTYAGDDLLPRHALMKVCVKKPQPDPILQFDCEVFCRDDEVDSEFVIQNVNYLRSLNTLSSSRYKGPIFRLKDISWEMAREFLAVGNVL
ncbi:hypothetical protein Taro_009083 [Colocasia esculenta]|uniref:Uncharacterized protein n=1 Tax=Colocasia esculenta TaxID=4460 RepID=A0A843TZD5_COLES|nr:hypothetical protein [Colocasia esculenta]